MKRENGLPAIHPGAFLREMLEELNVTQAEFARLIGVSAMRVSHVVKGTRPVTAQLAMLFGRAFGQSAEYWLNLQTAYDLKTAKPIPTDRLRVLSSAARRWSSSTGRPAER